MPELEIEALGGVKSEREKFVQGLVETLSGYEKVRDLSQHPGWGAFISEFQRRAVIERSIVDDLLDAILLERTSGRESEFTEAKIRLLVLEECIQVYLKMRERASEAKNLFDTAPPEMQELPQNG